jgi:HD-like signal output (HDOD) protein
MNKIDPRVLKQLLPVGELNSAGRLHLSRLFKIKKINAGSKLYGKDYLKQFVYLVEGKVERFAEHIEAQIIHAGDAQARRSLFSDDLDKPYVTASVSSEFIFLPREQFYCLLDDDLVMEDERSETGVGEIETNIYNEIVQAIESSRLKLPSLPEVALKVKSLTAKNNVAIPDLAHILKSDPAIVVKLIQAANSVLTRGVEPVKSIHDAIVRLGLLATQNLVISFSIKQLFQVKQQILKLRMQQMYEHSIEISAISFALSKKLKCFDADQLLLAGLIHDIGVIPILTYIDETGFEIRSEKEVDNVVAKLRAAVGCLVIKNWGFTDDMVAVVEHAENWFRKNPNATDMADIVIVAQLYNLLQHKKLAALPDIKQVTVLKKMFAEEKPDAGFVADILSDAQQMIDEVKRMLST